MTLTAPLLLLAACGAPPGLTGAEGSRVTLLLAALPAGPDTALQQRPPGGDWAVIGNASGGERWLVPTTPGALYRLYDVAHDLPGPALAPPLLRLSLSVDHPEVLLPASAEASLTLSIDGPGDLPPGALRLSRGERALLDEPLDALGGPLSLSLEVRNEAEAPREMHLEAAILTDDGQRLSETGISYLEWRGDWAWGDLHAHSNLSMDGCEDPAANCASRAGEPGADFFLQARDRGLDFAAITDHAEYMTWFPEGEDLPRGIWPAQVALAREADGGPVLPILGYEWTYSATQAPAGEGAHYVGGHKTVLLPDLTGCDDARIAAPERDPIYVKAARGAMFVGGNPREASKPDQLYRQLAGSACGQGALTFFHHGAYEWPQPVDWTLAANQPDPDFETLVEIYSEHGSSECADLDAPGCSWRLRGDSRYWGQGSVQAALAMGYQLGFVAGTDAHDARPGSTDDGPSCTAAWSDQDGDGLAESPHCLYWQGGLTGVLAAPGLDREGLFAALRARHTAATSGPQPALRAAARGADGTLYLPGDVLGDDAWPARVVVEVEGAESLALINSWGDTRLEAEGSLLDGTLDLAPGEAAYVRVQLGGDERIWLSPWFSD